MDSSEAAIEGGAVGANEGFNAYKLARRSQVLFAFSSNGGGASLIAILWISQLSGETIVVDRAASSVANYRWCRPQTELNESERGSGREIEGGWFHSRRCPFQGFIGASMSR